MEILDINLPSKSNPVFWGKIGKLRYDQLSSAELTNIVLNGKAINGST